MIHLPRTRGGWRCLIADPPWRFSDRATRGAAERHYGTMSLADLCRMPVAEVAAPAAHLYLWVTDAHLLDGSALAVCRAWGFVPKQLLDWVKAGPDGRLQVGMGHWFRHTSEHVVFATRGRAPGRRHDIRATFMAPRTRHSAKPAALVEMAEAMSPGPRLELFARGSDRPGWTIWGQEAGKEAA